MPVSYDELKELFANFQWIDDIPEDWNEQRRLFGFPER